MTRQNALRRSSGGRSIPWLFAAVALVLLSQTGLGARVAALFWTGAMMLFLVALAISMRDARSTRSHQGSPGSERPGE